MTDVESIYWDTAVVDVSYDNFNDYCREAWEDDFNYLFIVESEKNDGNYCICSENKNHLH